MNAAKRKTKEDDTKMYKNPMWSRERDQKERQGAKREPKGSQMGAKSDQNGDKMLPK
jgi:hypothetical protein